MLGTAALGDDRLALLVQHTPCRSPSDLGRLLLLQEQRLVLGIDELVHLSQQQPHAKERKSRTKRRTTTTHKNQNKTKSREQGVGRLLLLLNSKTGIGGVLTVPSRET